MCKLAGRSIIITGASRGIGRATVLSCIREGAYVGINYLQSDVAAEELKERYPASVALLRFDVADQDAASRKIREFSESRGRLDAIVNNAGVFRPRILLGNKELASVPLEIRVNLLGAMICTQAALPCLLKTKTGTIINVSSCAAIHPGPGQSIYAASKAGVEAFTRAIALEYADRGVRCMCVRLGPADTDMLKGAGDNIYNSMSNRTLLKRLSTPEEIGDFIAMLLTDSAAITIGAVLDLTMGYTAR